MTYEQIARHHFPRMWAERNEERVHVFADGTVFDRTARRRDVRSNIRLQRIERMRANERS